MAKNFITIGICSLTYIAIFFCSSCSKLSIGTPPSYKFSILPGDCLNSTEVLLHNAYIEDWAGEHINYHMSFKLDFYGITETQMKRILNGNTDIDYFPTDECFNRFGSNRTYVRKKYITFLQETHKNSPLLKGAIDGTTLFYGGGMVLTADKDFAGITAGENLAPLFQWHSAYAYDRDTGIKMSEDFGVDYSMIVGYYFGFMLPLHDLVYKAEMVTFSLDIPVNKVDLLSWFNDTIDNPAAPVPVSDVVLHCRFKTKYNFMVKENAAAQ